MHSFAIVGAGFAGVAVAVRLMLQAQEPLHIRLINRASQFGRGLA